jgi:hypothetical protein
MTDIDVVYGPDHEPVPLNGLRPQLSWGNDPVLGSGWRLVWLDETGDNGDYFIPGDLLDVDEAVAAAQRWLALERE